MFNLKRNVILILLTAFSFTAGCSSMSSSTELEEIGSIDGNEPVRVVRQGSKPQDANGQATLIWEEPMVDVIDVPPGLDPEGHYYRPAHKSIVEIRQGRWQYYDRRK